MKKWIVILFFPICVLAQDDVFFDSDTIFLDENWFETESRADAEFYRKARMTQDSLLYIQDYYLETKSLQMIGTYLREMSNENKTGLFTFYYRNGHIKTTYNYINGQLNGKVYKYNEEGVLRSIENYKNDEIADTVWLFHENGQMKFIKILNPEYDAQIPEDLNKEYFLLSAWDEEGNQQVENGTGRFIQFRENGLKELQIDYEDGVPHGEWIRYAPKKRRIASKMTFKEGRFIKGVMYNGFKKDVFSSLYRPPRFPSGVRGLDQFINRQTGNCENSKEKEIRIIINVSKKGQVIFEQVLEGNVNHCQLDEVQDMVKKMPRWIPAVKDGYYIEASYVIRIRY